MKKITLLLFLVALSVSLFAQPWAHRYATEQASQNINVDINTSFTVSVEWGEGDWTSTSFGYGLSSDGSNWTWIDLPWFQNGDVSNKRCKTSLNISSPGKYYYAYRLVKNGTTSYSFGTDSWAQNSTTLAANSYIAVADFTISAGNWSNQSIWYSGVVPGSTKNVGIYHDVTLNQNADVKSLTINSGATFTASDGTARTLTIAKSALGSSTTLANSGTWTNGSGGSTVVFTGAPGSGDAVHAISGTIVFNNLTINKTGGTSNIGASFGSGSSLTGTLEIGTGGYISTNPPTSFYGTGAILKFNQGTGATYDVNAGDKTWSTTEIPQNITIASGKVRVNENRTATGSLIVATDATLEVSAAIQLKINTALTNNGTLNLLSGASGTATLKTPSTISGSGSYKVQQYLTNQSWYLSSPVSGTVTPTNLSRIQSYIEGSGTGYDWSTSGTTMTAGKGYITGVSTAPTTVEFTGTINSGNIISIPLTRYAATDANKYGFNLIGNPYTAYLDWKLVSAANSSKMQTSTMWYRTKVSGSWAFSTVNGSGVASPENVSYLIPPMQAFWVRASTVGNSNLELTNNMVVQDNNASNKLKAPAAAKTELQMVRLQVSNSTNTDELVIYTDAQALNSFDTYDSPKMSIEGDDFPEISSIVDNESLVINGLNSLTLNTALPIRFVTKTANTFTLKANQVSNLPEGVKVILKDYATEFDLTSGAEYNFTSDITDTSNRFSLIFRSPGAITSLNKTVDNSIIAYSNNKGIAIKVNDEKLIGAEIFIYNALGQKVINKQLSGSIMNIDDSFVPDVYTIKVNNITKKVIVK